MSAIPVRHAPAARLQTKLTIGAANDPAEHEADQIADRIMQTGEATAGGHGTCEECAESRRPGGPTPVIVRRSGGGETANITTDNVLAGLGAGSPLSSADRDFFEPRFGQDFSHIRVHTGGSAAAASRAIGARAFAFGSDIGFAEGELRPGSAAGRWLMAHELTHVLQGGNVLRRKCKDPPPDCAEAQLTKAQGKAGASTTFKDFVFKAATGACFRPTEIAASIKDADSGLFDGRLAAYVSQAVEPVNGLGPKTVYHAGDCFAFPRGWKDPNIGDIDQQLAALNADTAEKNRIVATIYAEQAGASASVDEQRKYIFFAMLLRIKGAEWGPTFQDVVQPGVFHASDPSNKSYARNFVPAKTHLEGGKADPDRPVNAAAVDRLKAMVEGMKAANVPVDAGPYYFHWSEATVTAERAYQAALKAGDTKDVAEKKGAFKQAKEVVGATMKGVTESSGWLKMIRGISAAPDERVGSMYIYK